MKTPDRKIKVPVKHRTAGFADPLKYTIVNDTMVTLSKKMAFEFLELHTFQGERAVREGHVQFLFDEYTAGRFLWHHVLIASAIMNGVEYRINGQHTCWMRVNIPDKEEPVPAKCRVIQYKVDTSDQLRTLYSAFDRNAPRTVGHISKVMLIDTKAGKELTASIISKMVAGFRIYFAEDWHTANANPSELTAIISNNYTELFNLVGHFVMQHYEDHAFVRRAAIVAAMLATFEKAVKPSIDFWGPVCDGIGLEAKTDARYQLRQYLMTHGHSIMAGTLKISQEEAYRACINTWNRWRKGDPVSVVRSTDERIKPV